MPEPDRPLNWLLRNWINWHQDVFHAEQGGGDAIESHEFVFVADFPELDDGDTYPNRAFTVDSDSPLLVDDQFIELTRGVYKIAVTETIATTADSPTFNDFNVDVEILTANPDPIDDASVFSIWMEPIRFGQFELYFGGYGTIEEVNEQFDAGAFTTFVHVKETTRIYPNVYAYTNDPGHALHVELTIQVSEAQDGRLLDDQRREVRIYNVSPALADPMLTPGVSYNLPFNGSDVVVCVRTDTGSYGGVSPESADILDPNFEYINLEVASLEDVDLSAFLMGTEDMRGWRARREDPNAANKAAYVSENLLDVYARVSMSDAIAAEQFRGIQVRLHKFVFADDTLTGAPVQLLLSAYQRFILPSDGYPSQWLHLGPVLFDRKSVIQPAVFLGSGDFEDLQLMAVEWEARRLPRIAREAIDGTDTFLRSG